tara:strand:+ start:1133 stop:1432 length:300 start_codon:yes stop_codon:yes gene_type:complete
MLETFMIVALLGVAVLVAASWRMQWRWNQDMQYRISDAVDEAVKRQDDRIRKKLERSTSTDVGQAPDTYRTVVNGVEKVMRRGSIGAGVPLGRSIIRGE